MKSASILSLLGCAVIAHAAPEPPAIPADPAIAAKAFYTKVRELKIDGVPMGEKWLTLLPLVTPEFAAAIHSAQAEQAEAIKNAPGEKPPWIEGDLFSSTFEGVQQFTVGQAKITGNKAEVPVSCTYTYAGSTVKWSDTLIMLKMAKGWLFDDMRFGGEWSFGNKGTLKQSLAPGAD